MHENNRFIVIMAGGTGTRLWPLSRKKKPKQFHAFVSKKTLLQETFDRAKLVVPEDRIFVSTGASHIPFVKEQLPSLATENLIVEPVGKNTAPAIAYIAAVFAYRFPGASVATIASDHAIENPEEFSRTLDAAFSALTSHPDALLTIGINPTRPDTNYGYIKMGNELESKVADTRLFQIEHFKEKPDRATAESYLANFEYLWNAGYFIFKSESLIDSFERFAPHLFSFASGVTELLKKNISDPREYLPLFSTLPSEPIDTVLAEKLPKEKRLVVPSALAWSDVGGWHTLYEFLSEKHGETEIVRGERIDLESKNCLVYGDKRLIVTAGLKDMIIVDTDDAILIADRDTLSRDMKKLLEQLSDEKK